MVLRVAVYLLALVELVGLILTGLAFALYAAQPPGSDPTGLGAALLVLGWLYAGPVLALGSVLLAGLVRWQGERLQKWERVAAYLIAAGGLILALVLLGMFVAGTMRG